MAWFKVDDRFHDHPKTEDLTLEAVGLWTLAGTWSASNLTDGLVSQRRIHRLGGTVVLADALVDAGLWVKTEDGGYQFHEWAKYQPTRAEIETKREKDREKKQTQRRGPRGTWVGREGVSPDASGTPPGTRPGTPPGTPGGCPAVSRTVPTRPDPTRPQETPLVLRTRPRRPPPGTPTNSKRSGRRGPRNGG